MLNKNKDLSYIDQLTWLRGLAAFFVISAHVVRATEVAYTNNDVVSQFFLLSLFDIGEFGVVLFFTLSGCTLYISNINKLSINNLIPFYKKRFFRIWPAFIVALLIYIVFGFVFSEFYVEPQNFWIEQQFLSSYTFKDVLYYMTLAFNFTGPSELFNNAFWSLPVEFQYYLIFPLLIFLLKYTGVLGPIIVGCLLYLLPSFIAVNSNSVFTLSLSFIGGILIGHSYKHKKYVFNLWFSVALLVSLLLLTSAIKNNFIALPDLPLISNKWNCYQIIAVLTVYLVISTPFRLDKKLSAFLGHYGTISYSTYLYHNLVIGWAVLLIIQFPIESGDLRLLFTFSFTFLLSYFLANISYKLVEIPSIALGKRKK